MSLLKFASFILVGVYGFPKIGDFLRDKDAHKVSSELEINLFM